jgi:hypothetical protein
VSADIQFGFVARGEPLSAIGAAVPRAKVALLLARRRDRLMGSDLLHAACSRDTLILLGPPDALPWAPGIVYLGRDPGAPRLLLPTAAEPTVPVQLLERALFARFPDARSPAALLLSPIRLVEAHAPERLDLDALERWVCGDNP